MELHRAPPPNAKKEERKERKLRGEGKGAGKKR
jgi:hypothetical protein